MNQDDNDIIPSILRGEAQGYRRMMERYGRQVQLVVAQLLERQADVEEVTQDTFLKVFNTLARYDERRASLSTWISRIAYNTALNRMRTSRPKTVPLEPEAIDALGEAGHLYNLEDTDIREEHLALLDEALGCLRPEERLLVHLRYYEGRSLSEISYVVDVGPEALASRLQRIRHKLYRLITSRKHGTPPVGTRRVASDESGTNNTDIINENI